MPPRSYIVNSISHLITLLQVLHSFILRMIAMLLMLFVDLTTHLLVTTDGGFRWSGLGYAIILSFFFMFTILSSSIFVGINAL